MTHQDTNGEAGTLNSTQLAGERTVLALERTLMAWVRTATSLISFGFSIYKFFQYLSETNKIPQHTRSLGPREFAMLMIAIAVVMLVLATLYHWRSLKALRRARFNVPRSLAMLLAALISGLAIVALLAVIFRQ